MDCDRCHQTVDDPLLPEVRWRDIRSVIVARYCLKCWSGVRDNLDSIHPTLKRIRRGRRGGLGVMRVGERTHYRVVLGRPPGDPGTKRGTVWHRTSEGSGDAQ